MDVPCSFVPQMPVDDVPTEARCLIFGDVPVIQILVVGCVRGGVGREEGGGRMGAVMQSSTLTSVLSQLISGLSTITKWCPSGNP